MSDSASYLVDGKQLSADQCRTMFGGMSLPERQSKVLERLEGRTIVDVGCHTGLSGPGMSYAWTPQTLLTLLKVNGFEYVDHCYENGVRNPIGRWFLAALPFLGPTQILKVRKVASGGEAGLIRMTTTAREIPRAALSYSVARQPLVTSGGM